MEGESNTFARVSNDFLFTPGFSRVVRKIRLLGNRLNGFPQTAVTNT